jgi:hypothetical protein
LATGNRQSSIREKSVASFSRYDDHPSMQVGRYIGGIASALTERRVRVHGILLAMCLWSVYAVDLATPGMRDRFGMPKGADFLHFYTLGVLANRNDATKLYDMAAQTQLMPALLAESAGMSYIPLYGPQVALLFAPFARLSYVQALIAWWIVSAAL